MKEVSSKIRNWCARGERSPAQVLRKLSDWGVVGEAQEELAALMKEDYVNVSRFAEAFIHDHIVLKNWGPAKVWSALRQVHGLDSGIIRSGIEALGRQEVEAAGELSEEQILAEYEREKKKERGYAGGWGIV